MNYQDYYRNLEANPEYHQAERDLQVRLDLADEVLRLRIEKGWSQAELAEHADTKQANISRIESGLSNPSLRFLEKLAKALDTTLTIRLERVQLPSISTDTGGNAQNQSIYVPNWPQGKVYTSYERSSSK